jgi:ABC-type uncharacterized transport system substrate-binding protein
MKAATSGLFAARLLAGGAALLWARSPAWAHPHVFVSVHSTLAIDTDKKITSIQQVWTFDEMYTAFAVTGFGADAETPSSADLQGIAKQNMADMKEYNYFTVLKNSADRAAFAEPVDYSADLKKTKDDYSLVLRFTLPLKTPFSVGSATTLQVYDPSYFVSFTFAKPDGVTFSGAGKCSTNLTKPTPLSASEQQSLTESFFTNMLPGTDFGIKLAEIVLISCT